MERTRAWGAAAALEDAEAGPDKSDTPDLMGLLAERRPVPEYEQLEFDFDADPENPQRLVRARLRALGMTNDDRAALRYFSRNGSASARTATRSGSDGWPRSTSRTSS